MAEEEDGGPKYKFITENSEEKDTSRGYSGKALAMYPNGDTYEGEFMDGIRESRGIYRYASSNEKYDGEWKHNMKHGIGRMTYAKAGEYNGFWENGRRHGEGVFTYSNGDVYSGWWKFGEKEGTGCYTFKSTGMKLYGDWTAGSISKGRWIYPNGMYYEGDFENNKPIGKG
jgi:radial spoke head protein 1